MGWLMSEILLVDDEEEFLEKLEKFLQYRLKDCSFAKAGNGKAALDIADNQRFDLIICDYEMPVMDGGGFISGIRSWKLQTPVILLTTLCLEQSYSQMGFDSFVHKSDLETSLLKEVRKFL